MADGENNIVPRPEGQYWAAVPAAELGVQVQSRYLEYIRELNLRGLVGLWQRIASTHYGYDPHTDSLSDWVSAGGEEGELLKLPVKVKSDGRYFVRIVHKDGAKTAYSVRAVMGDGGDGNAVPDL